MENYHLFRLVGEQKHVADESSTNIDIFQINLTDENKINRVAIAEIGLLCWGLEMVPRFRIILFGSFRHKNNFEL